MVFLIQVAIAVSDSDSEAPTHEGYEFCLKRES